MRRWLWKSSKLRVERRAELLGRPMPHFANIRLPSGAWTKPSLQWQSIGIAVECFLNGTQLQSSNSSDLPRLILPLNPLPIPPTTYMNVCSYSFICVSSDLP